MSDLAADYPPEGWRKSTPEDEDEYRPCLDGLHLDCGCEFLPREITDADRSAPQPEF